MGHQHQRHLQTATDNVLHGTVDEIVVSCSAGRRVVVGSTSALTGSHGGFAGDEGAACDTAFTWSTP